MLPELDQSRLLAMQFQAELGQSFSKLAEKTFGFCPAFEAHDQIVGVADDNYLAHGHSLAPGFYPQVENVVQVHVGEQRRNDSPNAKDNFEFERRLAFRRKSGSR
jgi:hypothetical protein